MRAVVITEPGPADVLRWSDVPDPTISDDEVLVQVAASAVNRADLLQRQGFYDPPPGASRYPGLECSGTIVALGDSVTGWSVGDRCLALLSGGGYAELVAVPAGQLLPVPDGMDLVTAAALPEVTCTVWSNLFLTARLRAGEVLLVHGGGSGIGTMAIQVAVAAGARVAVTAGSAAKLSPCRELGAEITIDYHEQDFVSVLRAATDGHGADVVLDNMGAAYLARNVDVLAPDGRIVVIGLQGGRRAELDLGKLLTLRGSVTATSLRQRPAAQKAQICAGTVAHVWPLLASGAVRPVVDRVLPMPDAAAAHRVLEESSHVGKVLLAVP